MSAPTITREQWLAMRQGTLGSSEAAAALGEDPYKSPFRLWAEKRGEIEPDDVSDLPAVRRGRALQGFVVDEFARSHDVSVCSRESVEAALTRDGACEILGWVDGTEPFVRSKRYPWMTATLDALVGWRMGRVALVEAKAPGIRQLARWGEDGTAPDHYRLQVAHALLVVPAIVEVGYLVAMVGAETYREVECQRAEIPEQAIVTLEQEFMRCLESGQHPRLDGSPATREALKKLHPDDSGEVVELPADAIAWHSELDELKLRLKGDTARAEELKTLLMGAIGGATFGALPDGSGTYSLKTTQRDEYVVQATKFRTLRFAATKAARSSK